jgi:hypothetical protein
LLRGAEMTRWAVSRVRIHLQLGALCRTVFVKKFVSVVDRPRYRLRSNAIDQLPDVFGPYTTCYDRFVRWRRAGFQSIALPGPQYR